MPARPRRQPAPRSRGPGRAASSNRSSALALCDRLGLGRAVCARLIGISPRTLGTLVAGGAPTPQTARRLAETARLLRALASVIDRDFIAEWLETPNDAFNGLKPIEVVDRGQADRLWQMIHALRSGEPT